LPRQELSRGVGGLITESIAYYGTYIVNEAERVIILHLEASTFPNQIGTDQKRTITFLMTDELRYNSPAAMSGVQIHQVWKRAE
jgi:Lipocalin-like domain